MYKAGPAFELLAENVIDEYTLSSPAVSEGQIFIRTDAALYDGFPGDADKRLFAKVRSAPPAELAGYAAHILHRTGHSLGESVHGNGVHLDDYETHDDRRLLPGAGFTIEPGLYFKTFGVRTEINMFRGEREAFVTGPRQMEIMTLGN